MPVNPDIFANGQVRDVFIPFSDGYISQDGKYGKTRPAVIVGWSPEISDFGRSVMFVPITSFGSGGYPTDHDVKLDHFYNGRQCYAQPHRLLTIQRDAIYDARNISITTAQFDEIMSGVLAFFPDDPSVKVKIPLSGRISIGT